MMKMVKKRCLVVLNCRGFIYRNKGQEQMKTCFGKQENLSGGHAVEHSLQPFRIHYFHNVFFVHAVNRSLCTKSVRKSEAFTCSTSMGRQFLTFGHANAQKRLPVIDTSVGI